MPPPLRPEPSSRGSAAVTHRVPPDRRRHQARCGGREWAALSRRRGLPSASKRPCSAPSVQRDQRTATRVKLSPQSLVQNLSSYDVLKTAQQAAPFPASHRVDSSFVVGVGLHEAGFYEGQRLGQNPRGDILLWIEPVVGIQDARPALRTGRTHPDAD